jgi:hypothetical protein
MKSEKDHKIREIERKNKRIEKTYPIFD